MFYVINKEYPRETNINSLLYKRENNCYISEYSSSHKQSIQDDIKFYYKETILDRVQSFHNTFVDKFCLPLKEKKIPHLYSAF